MTSICHTAPAAGAELPAARFEAARLADGWGVVDLLSETAIVPKRPWDESTATMAADALEDTPAYAVHFRWSPPPDSGSGGSQHAGAARPFRLAIVGSRSLDGNPEALRVIRNVLDAYQARHAALVVVSGGAAGIDRMAAEEARRRGLQVVEHRPKGRSWRHYRARNLRIVKDCDELVRIADPRSRSFGSGWTRDRAREFGRPTTEYTITGRPLEPCGPAAAALRGESDA